MRRRIDIDALWRSAREQSMLAYDGAEQVVVTRLPLAAPFSIDDLIADRIDVVALVDRLRGQTAV